MARPYLGSPGYHLHWVGNGNEEAARENNSYGKSRLRREAVSTSITEFQMKLKNGHGLNENKQEDTCVKTALEMTK